jgi:hypothetical protein
MESDVGNAGSKTVFRFFDDEGVAHGSLGNATLFHGRDCVDPSRPREGRQNS